MNPYQGLDEDDQLAVAILASMIATPYSAGGDVAISSVPSGPATPSTAACLGPQHAFQMSTASTAPQYAGLLPLDHQTYPSFIPSAHSSAWAPPISLPIFPTVSNNMLAPLLVNTTGIAVDDEDAQQAVRAAVGAEYARQDSIRAQQGAPGRLYNEATGRFHQAVQRRPRIGLPSADRSNLGWRYIHPRNQPEAFRTPAEQAEANAIFRESSERLGSMIRRDQQVGRVRRTGGRGSGSGNTHRSSRSAPQAVEEMESESEPELASAVDDDETGTYGEPAIGRGGAARRRGRRNVAPSGRGSFNLNPAAPAFVMGAAHPQPQSGADEENSVEEDSDEVTDAQRAAWARRPRLLPASVNPAANMPPPYVRSGPAADPAPAVESDGSDDPNAESPKDVAADPWKLNENHSDPLRYNVPADLNGEVKTETIRFRVDFTDPKLVTEANKRRRQAISRANKALGITNRLRPSTMGREYTDENEQFIVRAYRDYAANNRGRRIPASQLQQIYNQRFSSESRTVASLTSHIDRVPRLRAVRDSYPR